MDQSRSKTVARTGVRCALPRVVLGWRRRRDPVSPEKEWVRQPAWALSAPVATWRTGATDTAEGVGRRGWEVEAPMPVVTSTRQRYTSGLRTAQAYRTHTG